MTHAELRRGILWRRARQPGCRAPIPRPENLGDTSRAPWRKLAKYQKPRRGCRRGFGWQYRGGSLPNSRWDSGDRGGRAVHLAINHLVAPWSQEVQAGGTRYRIRFQAGRGYIAARYAYGSAFHRTLPAVTCRPSAVRHQLDSSTRDEAMEAFARCWFRKAC
jgi:hypothetical protein